MNRVFSLIALTVCVAALVAVVSPVRAETVLFQENFEEPGAGNPGVSLTTLPGWTGSDKPYLSNHTVIDTGNCAEWQQKPAGWATTGYAFSDAPGAGDTYTLTATLYTSSVSGSNASVWLADSNSEAYQVGISMGWNYFNWYSYYPGGSKVINGTATNSEVDIKIALTAAAADFAYRAHGATTWISAGSLTTGFPLSTYKAVVMDINGGNYGAIDSIKLTTSAVPEPTTLALLATGLIGLLAYAWRKRK